jgi:hypothetical protein
MSDSPDSHTINGYVQGFRILEKYMGPDTCWKLQGEHDEILVYVNDTVSEEDKKTLSALGFYEADDIDENTWRIYT